MSLLLGIDLGTSFFKIGIFDESGELRGLGRVAVEKASPAPGHVELPIDLFWALLRRALADAMLGARASAAEIAGMSYSSQANTFVLLDGRGVPLTPLVSWMDRRAGSVPEDLRAFSAGVEFHDRVGFSGLAPESALVKWRWLQRDGAGVASRARWWMTISDYLTFALTGEPVGDASTAALLGIYDLRQRRWWTEALAAAGLDPSKLATPLLPGMRCGETNAEAAGLLGVPAGVPFAVGGLDHHVAAVGSGLGRLADASISMGTVLAALCLTDRVERAAGCQHGPHADGRRYYRLAFDPAGTGRLDEFRRRFAPEQDLEQLIGEAATVAPLSRPAGEPWTEGWAEQRPAAVRSLLEGVAFTQRDLVRRVSAGRALRTIAATGGGARSAFWLGLMADALDTTIVTPAATERACLGAATFASVAAGIHRDAGAATRAMVRPASRIEPQPATVAVYRSGT